MASRVRGRGAQIVLLQSVSNYVPRMGLTESPWNDEYFKSNQDIACGTITCKNWPPESLHQIRATVHVPTDLAIDAELSADPYTNLLGPFYSTDVNMEPLCICKTIYLPAPFVGIFLKQDLTPVEDWTRLCSTIIDGGIEVNFYL